MKELKKIAFVGFWKGFDVEQNLIFKILSKHYDLKICDRRSADYSICSLYNDDFIDATGIRIFYTAEAVAPDFTLFDYFIGFDELKFDDRYVRVPNYVMNLKYQDDINLLMRRHKDRHHDREKFCCWVCSNGSGDETRDVIFDKLSNYKKVDSGGRYRNNVGCDGGVCDKRAFQENYKFSLAVENTSYRGYTTEKLVEAFAAGGIPIYWGDPDVTKEFNPKAFVNLMDYSSIDEGIEVVKKIDQDDELYNEMVSQRALINQNSMEKSIDELEAFLINIFDQPIKEAYRRPHGQTAIWVNKMAQAGIMKRNTDKNGWALRKLLQLAKGLINWRNN